MRWLALPAIVAAAALIRQLPGWMLGSEIEAAQRERFLKMLTCLMGLFLFTGAMLFATAFHVSEMAIISEGGEAQRFNLSEYLLRSLVCSLDLFLLDIDSNVLDAIKSSPDLKGAISVQAVLSFACTIALMIVLVYSRAKAWWRLFVLSLRPHRRHLYVFFGINDPSETLAESIRRHDDDATILFVAAASTNEEDKEGWSSIVEMFTNRRKTYEQAERDNTFVTISSSPLYDLQPECDECDILSMINLPRIRRLIRRIGRKAGAQMHLFFLSDREDENLRSITTIAHDTTIRNFGCTVTLYCHARRNGINRVVEDMAVRKGMEVRIVDSSHIAVETLRGNAAHHPVTLVDTADDNPTTVCSPLTCLLVGFDETGQDALGFLYEFGAFVDSSSTAEHCRRSPFRCTAVDIAMDRLGSVYRHYRPAVFSQTNADGSPLVSLVTADCDSETFYNDIVLPAARSLNIIVVAMGDDERGITLAVSLLNFIRQQRADLSRLRIYVRSYSKGKEHYMRQIERHYNEGCGHDVIHLFGMAADVWSYDMIVDDTMLQRARRYYNRYCMVTGDSTTWEQRRANLTGGTMSLDRLQKLRRMETQDMCNALHAATKLRLMEAAGLQPAAVTFTQDEMERMTDDAYMHLAPMRKAVYNLAMLEHLRWNASHEMMGYRTADADTYDKAEAERRREHLCLRPWEDLHVGGDVKQYDFAVVQTSL